MKCPFCLENNDCSVDKASVVDNHQPCWCFAVNVPDGMLQLIPNEKFATLCICQKCITQYHQDQESFIKRFPVHR